MYNINLLKSYFQLYGNLKVKTKIMISFLVIIIIISTSVSSFYYYRSTEIIKGNSVRQFTSLMDQLIINMNHLLITIEDASRYYTSNTTLLRIFEKGLYDPYPLRHQLDDYQYLSKLCNGDSFNNNIERIKMYFKTDAIYTRENFNFFNIKDIEGKDWFDRVIFANGAPIWVYDASTKTISCFRSVIDYNIDKDELGIIEITLKPDSVISILESITHYSGGNISLINDFNKEVLFPRGINTISNIFLVDAYKKSLEIKTSNAFRKEEDLILYGKLSNNWTVISNLPLSYIRKSFNSIFFDVVIVCIISSILALFLTSLLSKNLSNRINRIVDFVKNVDINSPKYLSKKYNDEITIVETSINKMLHTISEYIEENNRINKLKKESDFNVLQEQINPHFLYNCLDSINWMAEELNAQDIAKMSRLLGKFFRLALSSGHQIITLEDELNHVKIYTQIMQMRFDGNINIFYDVDDDLLQAKVLKIILQPLVENSILHGIGGRLSQEGNILITVCRQDNNMRLSVKDDGVGMKEKTLHELYKNISFDETGSKSFGLRNVNKRIKLYYGKKYGLEIVSKYGEGTQIAMIIPLE